MVKITLSTPIIASTGSDEAGELIKADPALLKSLHQKTYEPLENFDEKLIDYIEFDSVKLDQEAPSFTVHYREEDNIIELFTYFIAERALSEDESKVLLEEYEGQMSDGMGSGLCQDLESEHDCEFEVYSLFEPENSTSTFMQAEI